MSAQSVNTVSLDGIRRSGKRRDRNARIHEIQECPICKIAYFGYTKTCKKRECVTALTKQTTQETAARRKKERERIMNEQARTEQVEPADPIMLQGFGFRALPEDKT